MEKAKYTAEQIAQWFINRAALDVDMFYGEYVTNMKLQKLLYFAQGLSLAIFDKALFNEDIEAWKHGPVVDNVYSKYKRYENNYIPDVTPIDVEPEIAAVLELVFEKYGIYTASGLRAITHEQEPYKKNYKDSVLHIKIPVTDIKKEFEKDKDELIKEYNANKRTLMDYAETSYINSVPGLKESILNADKKDAKEVNWEDDL